MSSIAPPPPPLNTVYIGWMEQKPNTPEDVRLVSIGRSFGIQVRTRLWFRKTWRTIHTNLTLDDAMYHVARMQERAQEDSREHV